MVKLNVLVTGANGFIGKSLINSLDQYRYNIFALDNKNDQSFGRSRITKIFVQDISLPFQLQETFDYVFHLAALNVTHVDKASHEGYHRINVMGTQNLIKAAHARKFIFMSTAKVYQKKGGDITEDSLVNPEGDYEKSKFAAEETCRRSLSPDQLVILRPVNIVGPGQAGKAVLPVFFRNAVENKPIDVFAPRKSILQFLYIDDVVRLFKMLLEKDSACGVFNLSSSDYISLEELASQIVHMTNSRSVVKFSNSEEISFGKVISQKAKDILGWRAQVTIEDMLYKYYASLRKDEK